MFQQLVRHPEKQTPQLVCQRRSGRRSYEQQGPATATPSLAEAGIPPSVCQPFPRLNGPMLTGTVSQKQLAGLAL